MEEMLELAGLGAKAMQTRAVEPINTATLEFYQVLIKEMVH